MNTKDELISALNGESQDLAPPAIFTQTATESQMDTCGCHWPDAIFDKDKMVKLALQLSKQFGYADARIPFDLTAEAQTLGCSIDLGSKCTQPAVIGSPWATGGIPELPDMISVDEFMQGERIRATIDAAEQIGKSNPDLFCVTSCVDAPQLSYYCLGTENALIGMMVEPDSLSKWSKALVKYSKAYAAALSEVSDAVMVIVEGSSDLLPPELFDTFVQPFAKEVIGSIKGFSISHTCGDTEAILDKLASLGQTALSVDTTRDSMSIVKKVGNKVKVVGGIDPISKLLQGTPDIIADTAKECSDLGFSIIMPECGVPPQTCDENMISLSYYRDLCNGPR